MKLNAAPQAGEGAKEVPCSVAALLEESVAPPRSVRGPPHTRGGTRRRPSSACAYCAAHRLT